MDVWLRRTLIALSIGGGFAGLALAFKGMIDAESEHPLYFIMLGGFGALYALTVVAGLIFAENPSRSAPLLVSLCCQMPCLSSPIITYHFSAGLSLTLGTVSGKLQVGYLLGSDWQLNLFGSMPWGFGINIVALVLFILLVQSKMPMPTAKR